MKRKVQAQRKFAQGAFVPPSAVSNPPPERRSGAAADPPPPEHTVFYSKMSADTLLDVISFQNLHKQREPVVLLRRLGKIQNHEPPVPPEPKKQESPKQRLATNTSAKPENKMMLRSRPGFKTQIIKKPFSRKRNIPRQTPIPDSSDLEDDRPLKYFARTVVTPRRQLRIHAQAKKIKADIKQAKVIPTLKKSILRVPIPIIKPIGSKRTLQSIKKLSRRRETSIKKRRLTAAKMMEKVTRGYSSDEMPPLRYSSESETDKREPKKLPTPTKLINNKTKKSINNGVDKQADLGGGVEKTTAEHISNGFKMPLRPNRRRDVRAAETKNISELKRKTRGQAPQKVEIQQKQPNATEVKEQHKKVEKVAPALPSKELSEPSTSQTLKEASLRNHNAPLSHNGARRHASIEGWLENATGANSSFEASVIPSVDLSHRSRSVDSLCPSERFKSVRDIVNAAERDLESSCKQRDCQACCRVNKLRQLKNMVQRSTVPDDVYEFNDDASSVSAFDSVCRATPPPPPLKRQDHHVYLDILPNGSHIIQINNLNKRNTIISACVIPKSQADIRNEFSLIEHENLLDQLLTKFRMSSKPDEREKVFKLSTGSQSATTPATTQSKDESNEPPSHRSARLSFTKKAGEPSGRRQSDGTENTSYSRGLNNARLLEAPVFHPSEAEFTDPIAYFEKISASAAKYGLCKVVPPEGFHPSCSVSDEIRFNVSNQYIARLYSRWGPAAREMCAIRAYLASQSVMFARSPLYEGIEVNLPKLYHIVQRNGGLKNVIEKKRWGRVAEEMRYTRPPNAEKRLDQLYVKYLLPYDTLSSQERQEIMVAVERCWNKKNQKMLDRAMNPLHRQKRLLGESDSSGDEAEEEGNMAWALAEAEDCVVSGRNMTLATFKKVASNAMETLFPSSQLPTPEEVEHEYWRLVLLGTEHVCVNTASIDTGEDGHGFTKNKTDPYGRHPWNLKMLSQNSGNVLRSLGPVLGVTVPTLHLGMVLSTSCWHRDPHGLPWVEYMHSGPPSIWYGIPDEQSDNFRKAVETLCPTSCQNKSIWLPSDITMIPPELLLEHNVTLSRVVQRPGEFIIVFPKAYSCSICTGYTQSESVYFATTSWLKNVTQVFQEVRDSCEPTMFSLEQLLLAVAMDPRVPLPALADVLANLSVIVRKEIDNRKALIDAGMPFTSAQQQKRVRQPKKRPAGAWNVREQDECEICRSTLYLSKVMDLTGKRSSVCLQHALRLLGTGHEASAGSLVVYYSSHELEEVVKSAERRLNP